MNRLLLAAVLLVGCHTCPVPPTPVQKKAEFDKHRPKDRIGDILNLGRVGVIPPWLIESYAEWVRYGYYQEKR